MHELVALAKKTIEAFVRNRKEISPPKELTPEMKVKAGVFVSLKKKREPARVYRNVHTLC